MDGETNDLRGSREHVTGPDAGRGSFGGTRRPTVQRVVLCWNHAQRCKREPRVPNPCASPRGQRTPGAMTRIAWSARALERLGQRPRQQRRLRGITLRER